MVKVEIIYAPKGKPLFHLTQFVPSESSIEQVLSLSGIYQIHSETKHLVVGVFGKKAGRDQIVQSGDRIEIYQPIECDPKQKRKERSA